MAFVAGPRQVGKTTLAKGLLDRDAFYFNWDIQSHRKKLVRDPEEFWRQAGIVEEGKKPRIVLDEIHKYPRWKRFLKGLYDAHGKGIEILVTGSGKLETYQKGGDSLLGRYHLYHLHPFTLGEFLRTESGPILTPAEFWKALTDRFDSIPVEAAQGLEQIERFTGFSKPLFRGNETKMRRWSLDHQNLIIREDLRDLTRIREIGLLESLVVLLPERVGSLLSINALREDLGVNFLTVQSWLGALERLYFLHEIRPYAGRFSRTLRREGKVYLFDYSVIENPAKRFENLVCLHLLKLCDAWTDLGYGDFHLWFVRDQQKREVDFLITERRKPYALIETKMNRQNPDSALRYFTERLKPLYSLQIARNTDKENRPYSRNGILCLPAVHFLYWI